MLLKCLTWLSWKPSIWRLHMGSYRQSPRSHLLPQYPSLSDPIRTVPPACTMDSAHPQEVYSLPIAVFAATGAFLIFYLVRVRPHAIFTPFPGPKAIPLIGNTREILSKEPWVQLGKLRKQCGVYRKLTRALSTYSLPLCRPYFISPSDRCSVVGIERCGGGSRAFRG